MGSTSFSQIDLHIHTSASDGRLTPAATVALAAQRGLRVISLTDHDSTAGVATVLEAARDSGIEVISGVEINTDTPHGETHMLGYLFDHADATLQQCLADRRRARLARGEGIVKKLAALGMKLSWDRVQQIAGADEGGAVGRPHVALALQEAGYVTSTQQAFEKYIGRGGPAYVEYEKLTPQEAIQIIRAAGGLAALAHPSSIAGLEDYLRPLIEAGLEGLECYYGQYTETTVRGLVEVAERMGLVATGGSDYHGSEEVTYNATLGGTPVPQTVVTKLKQRHSAQT